MDQSRKIVLWSAAILLPAAFYFSAIADLPHITVITVILLVVASLKSTGWRVSDRSVIYLTVLAMAITLFGNYLAPLKQDRFGFMAIFSRPNLSVPFVLYLGALAAGFRRRGHAIGMAAAASILAFGLGGDIRLDGLASERMGEVSKLVAAFPYFFGGTMTIAILAILFGSRSGQKRANWKRPVLLVFSLTAIVGLIWLEYWGYRQNENLFRSLENALLRIGIRQLYTTGRNAAQFGSTPNLMTGMSPEFLAMSDRVALRAVGDEPPGYLRSRSFHRYERGIWHSSEEALGTPLPTTISEGSLSADQLYSVIRMEKTPNVWDIFPDESLQGNVLMIPGDTVSMALIASRVLRFRDGRIEVEAFVREGGYSVFTETRDEESAMQLPDKPGKEFLEVPREVKPVTDGIVEELKLANYPTDAERFMKLQEYFDREFKYSLDWQGPKSEPIKEGDYRPRRRPVPEDMERRFEQRPGFRMGMRTVGRLAGGAVNPRRRQGRFRPRWRPSDPVKYFLTEHRRAHCELFASATALILRSAGVPTRYVTGVICNERHPSGKYYIARYGNAHAWVEAFDRQNKRWVVVDTTPPSITTPAARPDSWQEQLSSRGDYLRLAWFEVLSSLRRGHFAEGTMAALALVWEWLLYLVTHPAWGTLGGFVFGFLIWILLYRRKRRLSDHLTPERRKIQKEYFKLLKKLRRQKVIPKEEVPTAAELLAIVDRHPTMPPPRRIELTNYLNGYLVRRYSTRD